ncbi:hypothetical protein QFC22_005638 [Naganishia vaughanmartiniae]|uniref:Uncharacterized protein n=1 Tax=Naganishia vaughanmartiniae TaxID=1424756 RepID=A0ACC2WUP2_9TREE|nr:hypothetical protein QFC22_005638 [Naganishia vaughanmartiniae]
MSVSAGQSAPNSAASNISHSPLQMQQQQAAKIAFPSYGSKMAGLNEEPHNAAAAEAYRVKSPSALSHSTSMNEPVRSSSASGMNGVEGQPLPGNMSYLYHQQQQQHQYMNDLDANSRGFPTSNQQQNSSPFQQPSYGDITPGFVNGVPVPINMGMGVGMDDMIGKWIDGVGGGIMPNGLMSVDALSNLAAAAAGYGGTQQQHSGNMSQADRQAWLAKSIFGGHGQAQGQGGNGTGIQAAMEMYNGGGGGQQQQHKRQETQDHSRAPGMSSGTYGLPMHDGFSGGNPGFQAFMPEPMYGGPSQQPANELDHGMGYPAGDFDVAGMNAALANMNFGGLGDVRAHAGAGGVNLGIRPLAFGAAPTNHGPPSTSSGRGSINSASVPGSALSQLSAGSTGTGMTSLSAGSGNNNQQLQAGNMHGHHQSINVNSANGRAMIGGLLDEDVIPTAIVIKNIPFDVVKERMMEVISSLGAPLPYAFNYHYENNQFRGLAFANFRQPFEADSVVAALNGYDLLGRKLRVEYKKVLQVGEKERIEKEKAIRRMKSAQLRVGSTTPNSTMNPGFAAQQRPGMNGVPPMPGGGLARPGNRGWHSSHSFGEGSGPSDYQPYVSHVQSGNFTSSFDNPPIPQTGRTYSSQSASSPSSSGQADSAANTEAKEQESSSTPITVDHTDPWTFDMHTKLVMFMADRATDETTFSSNLTTREKRIVHALAERLGLQHADVEGRVIVGKVAASVPQNRTPLARPPMRKQGVQPGTYLHPHAAGASGQPHGLRNRTSMPNLNGMYTQSSTQREPSRLLSRQSNQNLRDFAMRTGNPHSSSTFSQQQQTRRPFVSASGAALQGSQGFNSIFGSSLAPSASGSALEIVPSPTSPSDPSMPNNLNLPSRGFAASRTSFRSRHGSTESARNAHASGVIGSQRPSSVNGMAPPMSATYRPEDRSGHTSGSSVIEEEEGSVDEKASRES